MLTLYYSPGACSLASHIALEEAGKAYESHRVSFAAKENYSDTYLRLNPRGKVPVLIAEGRVLTENVAILTYIAAIAPELGLLPEDPWARAQCLSRMAWYSNSVHPCFTRFARAERFTTDQRGKTGVADSGRQAFWASCEELDGLLGENGWAMGRHYTVCDPYTLIFYAWGLRADLPMHNLKKYTRFKERMIDRPAVRKTLEREESSLLSQPVRS